MVAKLFDIWLSCSRLLLSARDTSRALTPHSMLSYCKLTAMLTLHMRHSSGTTWQQNFQTTCTTCRLFLLQAIRVESAGHVETAILHIVETEASTAEMRGAAMHNRSAKHSFLFDQQGTLLHASKAALEAYDHGSGILYMQSTCLYACSAAKHADCI